MRKRWWLVLLLLLLAAAFGAWLGYTYGATRVPPPEIRTEIIEKMVPVEVVKEIEVPGPERVIERVKWRTETKEVPVEVVREVTRWLTPDCPVEEDEAPLEATLEATIGIESTKYEGLHPDTGKLVQGWVGEAWCGVRPIAPLGDITAPWTELTRAPFELTESMAESTRPPGTIDERLARWRLAFLAGLTSRPGAEVTANWQKRGRVGWYAGVAYDLDPTREFVPQREAYIRDDRWTVRGGVSFSLGRE